MTDQDTCTYTYYLDKIKKKLKHQGYIYDELSNTDALRQVYDLFYSNIIPDFDNTSDPAVLTYCGFYYECKYLDHHRSKTMKHIKELAREYYEKAANMNYKPAIDNLGDFMAYCYHDKLAKNYYEQSVASKNMHVTRDFGWYLHKHKKYNNAFVCFKKVILSGDKRMINDVLNKAIAKKEPYLSKIFLLCYKNSAHHHVLKYFIKYLKNNPTQVMQKLVCAYATRKNITQYQNEKIDKLKQCTT